MEKIYETAIDIIKKWEGVVLHPYFCPASKLTLGIGIRIDIRPERRYGGIMAKQIVARCNQILSNQRGNISKANKIIETEYHNLITEKEAMDDLYDILKSEYWNGIKKELPKGLTDNQISAILSLVFNIGVANFTESTLLRLLKDKKMDRAGLEFSKWIFSGGKKSKGLINRRKDEQELYFKK